LDEFLFEFLKGLLSLASPHKLGTFENFGHGGYNGVKITDEPPKRKLTHENSEHLA